MYTPKIFRQGISILCLLPALLLNCSEKNNQDAATQLLENQQKMETENQQLLAEKQTLKNQLTHAQQQKESLTDRVQKEKLKTIREERTALDISYSALIDSLGAIDIELAVLKDQREILAKQIDYSTLANQQANKALLKSVSDIDKKMDELETARRTEQERIPLEEQKIAISQKKAQAYEEELTLYLSDKNKLLRANAPDDKIKEADSRIRDTDNFIKAEYAKIDKARRSIRKADEQILGLDKQIQALNADIQTKYNNKDVVSGFMKAEANRLENEISRVTSKEKALTAIRTELADGKIDLQAQIATIDQQIEQVKNARLVSSAITVDAGNKSKPDKPLAVDQNENPVTEAPTPLETSQTALLAAEETTAGDAGSGNSLFWGILAIVAAILIVLLYFVGKRHSAQKQMAH